MKFKIKKWFLDNIQETATRYNIFIDVEDESRTENGIEADAEGYVTVIAENNVLAETEKAIKLCLCSGNVIGSYKGWKTWIPKSLIK